MNETSKVDANSTKSPVRSSHEALEHPEHESSVDRAADDSAKRAQNRMKNNEEHNPETKIFSK
jgi:hypothetical protein